MKKVATPIFSSSQLELLYIRKGLPSVKLYCLATEAVRLKVIG